MPTGANDVNHSIHVMSILTLLLTNSTARRFGAIAVRNIELVMAHAARAVHIRYEPITRLDGSFGFEP